MSSFPIHFGWLGIISPLLINLIIRVSGIPMLEAKYKGNKEFEDYQEEGAVLIPKIKVLVLFKPCYTLFYSYLQNYLDLFGIVIQD